jgi:Protein of unknown function (DUF4240)
VDELKFWAIVQKAHDQSSGDMNDKCERVTAALSTLSKDEAISFSHLFDSMMDRAYSWPLWAAAYIANGGCSDDTFSDFRSSLISRGRSAYENALADPESLAEDEFDEEIWFYEGYQYAVTEGVKAVVAAVVNREQPHPAEPSGNEWTEEEVYDLYPKLSAKFA